MGSGIRRWRRRYVTSVTGFECLRTELELLADEASIVGTDELVGVVV